MVKTKRIRGWIKEILNDGEKNTVEILDYVNDKCHHGSTMQQLGNVLSKCGFCKKTGYTSRGSLASGSYAIAKWGLK